MAAGEEPRRIGISSFGISGTNAHVILEEAPNPAAPNEISGVTTPAAGTRRVVGAQRAGPVRAGGPGGRLPPRGRRLLDLGFSLATTRAQFEHRALLVESDVDAVRTGLAGHRYLRGHAEPGLLAFLFTGQGSQRPGMGQELRAAYPVFARTLDRDRSARCGRSRSTTRPG